MRTAVCLLVAFTCLIFFIPGAAHSQTHSSKLPGNDSVSITQFSWTHTPDSSGVAGTLSIKNNTSGKTIKSITVSLIAFDSKGITLQERGATIRKLTRTTLVKAGSTASFIFPDAYRSNQVKTLNLLQVIVEFTNGSLEVLR